MNAEIYVKYVGKKSPCVNLSRHYKIAMKKSASSYWHTIVFLSTVNLYVG